MSGELTPSQFRYTTTNNRDLVIGDPTDSVGLLQPKYIVFQTNTTPGYTANPYIGVTYNGSSWSMSFSSNGSSVSSFALLNAPNTFTTASNNIFEGTSNFTGLVTFTNASANIFNSPVTFNYAAIYNGAATYNSSITLSGGLSVTGSSVFNSSISIIGGLTVSSTVTFKGNVLTLNNSNTTATTVGGGMVVEGTGSVVVAGITLATTTTTSDTWAIATNGAFPVNIMGDASHAITFKSPGLTAARTISYPDATGTMVIREAAFTGSKLLVATSDTQGIAESSVTLASITALGLGNFINGITSTTGNFSGAVSATSLSSSGIISATNGGVFGGTTSIAALTISGTTISTNSITATSFIGDGSALTGTASGLISGYTNELLVTATSSASTFYPVFVPNTGGSGTQEYNYANSSLSYVPSTGILTAVAFVGDGSALTGIVASGGTATSVPWSGLTGTPVDLTSLPNNGTTAIGLGSGHTYATQSWVASQLPSTTGLISLTSTLTGLTAGTSTPILSSMTLIGALADLQAQINAANAELAGGPFATEAWVTANFSPLGGGGSCFIAGSLVLMANYIWKAIEKIGVGDYVLGVDLLPNLVLEIQTPMLENRALVSFEDGSLTTSAEHTIWSRVNGKEWFSSRDTKQLAEEALLGIGANLVDSPFNNDVWEEMEYAHLTGFELHKTVRLEASPNTQLYQVICDRSKTYIVNGYVVGSIPDDRTFDYHSIKWEEILEREMAVY